jgi:hypothetical protein
MKTTNGIIQGRHLRAAIRAALRAAGFPACTTEVAELIRERHRIGTLLRDEVLPKQFPDFTSPADYRAIAEMDHGLWSSLPHMMGFGHQQAVAFHSLTQISTGIEPAVAELAAAFGTAIALLDFLVDTGGEVMKTAIFDAIDHDFVRGIFDPDSESEQVLARAYASTADPRVRLLYALLTICVAGFWNLRYREQNTSAWNRLAGTFIRMYEAQRTVTLCSVTSRAALHEMLHDVAAKSVLPFEAVYHVVALASSPCPASPDVEDSILDTVVTSGCLVWLIDDLVDLLDDHRTGSPNVVLLHLADSLAEQGRGWPSDADIYAAVEVFAAQIVAQLRGAFELRKFVSLTIAAWVKWPEDDVEHERPTRRAGTPEQRWNAAVAATDMLLRQQREDHAHSSFNRAMMLDALLEAHDAGLPVPRCVLDGEALAILREKQSAPALGLVIQVLFRAGGIALVCACDEAIGTGVSAITSSEDVRPDVLADFLHGVALYNVHGYGEALVCSAHYLETLQDGRGAWPSGWHEGLYYGTFRAMLALSVLIPESRALAKAREFLVREQRIDGAWGEERSYPLATAVAVLALGTLDDHSCGPAVERGIQHIVMTQEADGGWPASSCTDRSVTSALCLKALLTKPSQPDESVEVGRS